MNIPFYIFFYLFTISATLQLLFNYKKFEIARRISKPFCLLTLGLTFIFYKVEYPLIYISCFVAMIGDILLLFKSNKKLFALGGTFFTIEHILNFISISRVFNFFPIYIYFIVFPSMFIIGLLGTLRKQRKKLSFCATSYFSFQVSNLILAIVGLIMYQNIYLVYVIIGYILFIFSDFLIAYKIFYRNFRKRSFYLILTYLIAQPILLFGLVSL